MPPPWQWKLKVQDPLGHVLLSGLQPKNNNTEIPINSSAKYRAKRRSQAESQQGSRELDSSVSTLSKCIVSSSSLGMVQMDSTPRLAGEKEVGRNPGCDTEAAHVLLPYLSHNLPHRDPPLVMPFRSHTSFSAHTFDSSLSTTSDKELEHVKLTLPKRVVKTPLGCRQPTARLDEAIDILSTGSSCVALPQSLTTKQWINDA